MFTNDKSETVVLTLETLDIKWKFESRAHFFPLYILANLVGHAGIHEYIKYVYCAQYTVHTTSSKTSTTQPKCVYEEPRKVYVKDNITLCRWRTEPDTHLKHMCTKKPPAQSHLCFLKPFIFCITKDNKKSEGWVIRVHSNKISIAED